ncbi:MAG: MCP four helix bundle domain-containing protein [Nitrospinae bacterium]|nr:MCP four helix bundle domain-containing protein [Nitrospinota bacterium]
MKLSTKLIAGFIVVAAITAVTGMVGLFGTSRVKGGLEEVGAVRLPSVQGLLMMAGGQSGAGMAMRTLTISELPIAKRKEQYTRMAEFLKKADDGFNIYAPLPQTTEEAKMWEEFLPVWKKWRAELDKGVALSRKFDDFKLDDAMDVKWRVKAGAVEQMELVDDLSRFVAGSKEFKGNVDPAKSSFGMWFTALKTDDPQMQDAQMMVEGPFKRFYATAKQITELMARGNRAEAARLIPELHSSAGYLKNYMGKIHDIAGEADKLMLENQEQVLGPVAETFRDSNKRLEDLVKLNVAVANDAYAQAQSNATFSSILVIVTLIAAVVMALGLGVWLARAISRPILTVVTDLTSGAEQVAAASGQISTASQSLAEGATEQASSLEETSAALEEMASQTRQNADNAAEANNLASATRKAAEQGAEVMGKMIAAMTAINTSSEEISKIIKVIEEIAFQTNLLALNAAVEAARAGEHGKGFAVVAEEVRNLAQRSATAAKDTSALIEESVKRVGEGNEMAQASGEALNRIVESVKKVTDLVGEISVASHEQAQGVDQINTAVTQMDKVTQQNASNAEESAAASEELSAQAEKLNEVVADLTRIVEGNEAGARAVHAGGAAPRKGAPKLLKGPAPKPAARHTAPKAAARHDAPAKAESGDKPKKKAEEVIPLDEDFGDF